MTILNAKEAKEIVASAKEIRAKKVLEQINTVHPTIIADIGMNIRNTAIKGCNQANIEVSKYIGTYWIGIIKYYLQLLGYDVSYHASTEELIVVWERKNK